MRARLRTLGWAWVGVMLVVACRRSTTASETPDAAPSATPEHATRDRPPLDATLDAPLPTDAGAHDARIDDAATPDAQADAQAKLGPCDRCSTGELCVTTHISGGLVRPSGRQSRWTVSCVKLPRPCVAHPTCACLYANDPDYSGACSAKDGRLRVQRLLAEP